MNLNTFLPQYLIDSQSVDNDSNHYQTGSRPWELLKNNNDRRRREPWLRPAAPAITPSHREHPAAGIEMQIALRSHTYNQSQPHFHFQRARAGTAGPALDNQDRNMRRCFLRDSERLNLIALVVEFP